MLFGRIAHEMGYVSAKNLRECAADQEQSSLRIGQILLKRSLLTIDQFIEVLREQDRRSCEKRFRLVREIGRGGMAKVHLAEDLRLGRPVALKVLRKGDGNREGALTARFSHPNIATIYEAGAEDGASYLAMEYVDGETLETAQRRLDRDERLRILETVAEAAGHVHEQGVVHRDLKPANILLSKEGRPVVVDFGLAQEIGETAPASEISGTPLYMAPEQLEGGARAMPETDVWALGVMLYELLTGKLPFDGRDAEEVWRKIRESEPPSLRAVDETVPHELAAICRKALQKDPSRRYRTGTEFAQALRNRRMRAERKGLLRRVMDAVVKAS